MLAFVGRAVEGLLLILLLVAGALFHAATTEIPKRRTGESKQAVRRRLWAAYRAKWRVMLSSTAFWAAAGLITALAIFFSR